MVSTTRAPPGASARCAYSQEREPGRRRKVFDDLDRAHRRRSLSVVREQEVGQRPFDGIDATLLARRDGLRRDIHAEHPPAPPLEQREELALPHPRSSHSGVPVLRPQPIGEIPILEQLLLDRLLRAAERGFEPPVERVRQGGLLG